MSIDVMKQALAALDDVLQWSAEHSEVRAALRAAIEHAERPQTHSDDCWRWHHQCAVAKIERAQAQKPIAWVYAEGLQALKSGKPWVAYGNDGDGRIPLYLNDAVAPKVEPRASESGAGFESLPASPIPVIAWYSPATGLLLSEGEYIIRRHTGGVMPADITPLTWLSEVRHYEQLIASCQQQLDDNICALESAKEELKSMLQEMR